MDCCARLRNRFRECGQFCHNREKNTYCNKTGASWGRVIFLYSTYLIVVLAVFGLGLVGTSYYVRSGGIENQFDKRCLLPNNTPQLTIFPRLPKTVILWYSDESNKSHIITPDYYINYLDKYFEKYENLSSDIYVDCSDPDVNNKGKFCKFTKDMLGPCGKDGYGYRDGKPCIYLKLNKMRGWDPWTKTTTVDKESGHAEGEDDEFKGFSEEKTNNTMTAECTGSTSFGCDHMGKIHLYPKNLFQSYYFPYNGSDLYLSPLVGVQFQDLVRGLVVSITCSVWGIPMTKEVRTMLTAHIFVYINEGND